MYYHLRGQGHALVGKFVTVYIFMIYGENYGP